MFFPQLVSYQVVSVKIVTNRNIYANPFRKAGFPINEGTFQVALCCDLCGVTTGVHLNCHFMAKEPFMVCLLKT